MISWTILSLFVRKALSSRRWRCRCPRISRCGRCRGCGSSTLASLGTSGREITAILALAFEQSKGELSAANEYIFCEIVSLVSSKEELVASECVVRAESVLATLALPSSPVQLFSTFLGSSSSILARLREFRTKI